MPLPPRKFYTLQQAADKLSRDFKETVTIEDLIYYWAFDNLNFSIYLKELPKVTMIGDLCFWKKDEQTETRILYKNNQEQEIKLDFFNYYIEDGSEREDITILSDKINFRTTRIIPLSDEDRKKTTCYNGFFKINANIEINENILDIINNGYKIPLHNLLYSPTQYRDELNEEMILCFTYLDNKDFISIKNFYIMHYDLEQFINGNAKKINIDELINKPLRRDKQQNQANFIKALLQLHYGIEKPQDARNLLGLKGKLSKKFAAAGIECNISDNTLQNWLKDEF